VTQTPSLRSRLLISSISLGVAGAFVIVAVAALFASAQRQFLTYLQDGVREQRAAESIMTSVYGQMLAAYDQLQHPDSLGTARFDSLGEVAYSRLRDYIHQPMSLDARVLVEGINEVHRMMEVDAHSALAMLDRRDARGAATRIREMEARAAELSARLDQFIALREQERSAQHERAAARLRLWVAGLGIAIVGLTVAALFVVRVVLRSAVTPLTALSTAAEQLGRGDLSARVPPQRHRELAAVAESFNEMAVRMRDANAARERSEVSYKRLFNEAPIPLYRTSPDGRLLDANPAFVELLGYSSVEVVVGADVRPWYIHADQREQFSASMDEHGAVSNQLVELRRENGQPIWVLDTTRQVRDPETGAVAYEGGLVDVTRVRQVEQALRESGERFREMAEHITEAFFIFGVPAFRPIYVSPNWSEIWGRPLEEAYDAQLLFQTIHRDDRALIAASQSKVRGGNADEIVFRIVRPDETVRWVRGRAFPVRDTDGEVYRMVGVCEDITELRQAEERFTQAQKMEAVGRLAGGVAHDFNNLLTVIMAATELAQAEIDPASPVAAELAEIRRASDSAATLTRQLLAFSRRQIVDAVVFDLSDAVAETGKMLRRLIGEHIRLEMRLGSDTRVRTDPGQIEQVLTNLAVNARDAMPTGGILVIETSTIDVEPDDLAMHPDLSPGPFVVMAVSDTGSGMSDEVRARAFEPFFTTKEVGRGTGLGLATSHGIIKQAGGAIDIYSELNVGTTFRIYLPRVLDSPNRESPQPSAAVAAVGTETILMVEDEASVRRVGALILRRLGYTVVEARDGYEALKLLDSHEGAVHLLFTDVVLPGLGGRDLANRVRAERPGIKVLFASGYTDDMVLQGDIAARDAVLVQKPYTGLVLSQRVRAVLDS